MLVDQMLAALATMRQQLMPIDGPYSADQVETRLNTISTMRSFVLENDGVGFTNYLQRKLATSSDLICDLLETLYEHLGMVAPERATWDEFEEQFITPND